jgi:hypothetical protein
VDNVSYVTRTYSRLALGVPTSEMAHARRERENTPTK